MTYFYNRIKHAAKKLFINKWSVQYRTVLFYIINGNLILQIDYDNIFLLFVFFAQRFSNSFDRPAIGLK